MAETTTLKNKEDILRDIEEKLKEEKWTRAAIESYNVKNFIELDGVIRMSIDENYKEELKNLCKENLKHYQNSVVGLYIVGVLSLDESAVDDTHIPQLIKLFMDNKKYKIAEFLAEKLLSYRENKFALKTLEIVYESYGSTDELFNIKKRLVLIDNRDAGNAKFLGEYYEKSGDKEQAMFYYRLAIERYITLKSVKLVEDLWNKVIKLYPEDYNLVILMSRKIREVLGDERVADMVYNDFIRPTMKAEKYREALNVLKVIIDFKQGEKQLRKAIEDCYRNIYASHSQLDKYLKLSAIGQSWKPHREAIRIFESHIAFDAGVYVSHKSWGIGIVKEIQNDIVVVDFEGKKEHQMSLEIALRALNILDNDNIIIWKKYRADELKKMVDEEPLKVVELILRSHGKEATTTDIKNFLCPDILKEAGWNKWWNQVKKAMEGSNTVVQNLTKKNLLELRESELSMADEIVSKFKKTTNFDNKVKLLADFITRGGDINSPSAAALLNTFLEIVKASSESNEKKLTSYIVLKFSNYASYNDNDVDPVIIFGIKNLLDYYDGLDGELKKPFLLLLMKKQKDWDIKFADFITHSNFTKLDRFMLNELAMYEKFDVMNSVFSTAMNTFQEKPELFLWACRILLEEGDTNIKQVIGVKESEIIFRLLSLLDILNSEIDQKTNVGRNKKVIGGIQDLLFKRKILSNVIQKADESTVKSILSILNSTATLDEGAKEDAVNQILSQFPDMQRASTVQEKINIRPQFMVTKSAFETKKRELNHIMTVEIPENSRAIGEAMEKGDLRENAEYKAALEKQDQLKAAASKLESELNQVKVIEKDKVNTSIVDVGTKVTVKTEEGQNEVYIILGQWDVNFEQRIISYHSPLGKTLLDRKPGDDVLFDFNGEFKKFEVMKIELADFD